MNSLSLLNITTNYKKCPSERPYKLNTLSYLKFLIINSNVKSDVVDIYDWDENATHIVI